MSLESVVFDYFSVRGGAPEEHARITYPPTSSRSSASSSRASTLARHCSEMAAASPSNRGVALTRTWSPCSNWSAGPTRTQRQGPRRQASVVTRRRGAAVARAQVGPVAREARARGPCGVQPPRGDGELPRGRFPGWTVGFRSAQACLPPSGCSVQLHVVAARRPSMQNYGHCEPAQGFP